MLSYIYFALFFISGIAGLIYESIWSHYLKLFLGHAAYSQTLVLVIYMGGMAAGAWIAGNRLKKVSRFLHYYALVEIALGGAALLFHDFFIRYLHLSYNIVIPALDSPTLLFVYKWLTASCIILPQSMLLGATFPLMAAGFIRKFPGTSGYKIAVLYFTNTLGASVGVLISGFYLIDSFGLKGAIISAGILDIFVGVAIFLLCRKNPSIPPVAEREKSSLHINMAQPVLPNQNALLFIAGATAAASFMYEIGWIRMLSLVLGSSTHSFELMLSAFILGMALGSFFIRKKIDQIQNIPRTLVLVQVIMGAGALLSTITYGEMFYFMRFIMDSLSKNESGYLLYNIFSSVICMVIMLPSTICAGMVLPLIVHLFYRNGSGEKMISKVYSINTLGGIIGVVAAVWILMPLVGVRLLISIGGVIDIGIGFYILLSFKELSASRLRQSLFPVSSAVIVVTLSFGRIDPVLASSGVFRNGKIITSKRFVSYKDGRTASIALYRNGDNLVLSTNGKPDASVNTRGGTSGDEYTMSLASIIPLAIREDSSSAAVIGMGSGMTAHYLLFDTTLTSVDIVEIEPAMVTAAKRIGEKVEKTFTDKRSHIYIDDAKSFFSAHNRSYDIIISEPSNPWVSGVSGLFSRDFFQRIKHHLNEDGLLVQWFHAYESDISILVSIFKALREHFPNYQMYVAGSDLITIAARDSTTDLSLKRDVFTIPALTRSIGAMGFQSLDDLEALRYFSPPSFNPLIDLYNTPANSDYHPYVDLHAVKYRFIDEDIPQLDTLHDYIIPVRKILDSDTGYLHYPFRDTVPELCNFDQYDAAKRLYQELTADSDSALPSTDVTSPSFFLDYAFLAPHKVSFEKLHFTLLELLEKTLPFLSAKETKIMWKTISRNLSGMLFTEYEQNWIDFFGALCNYDMLNLQQSSRELLVQSDHIETEYIHQMLVVALFVASYTLNDTSGLDEIYNRFQATYTPDLMVRVAKKLVDQK